MGKDAPQAPVAFDAAVALKLGEGEAEAFVAHTEVGTQVGAGARLGGEGAHDLGGQVALGGIVLGLTELEVEVALVVVADEMQGDGIDGGGGAVLDGEPELVALLPQVEGGVDPCVEVAAAAEVLSGVAGAAVLAGVVDDDDGEVVLALQLAQVGEQARDVAGVVLVEPVQAYEGVEQEHAGRALGDERS